MFLSATHFKYPSGEYPIHIKQNDPSGVLIGTSGNKSLVDLPKLPNTPKVFSPSTVYSHLIALPGANLEGESTTSIYEGISIFSLYLIGIWIYNTGLKPKVELDVSGVQ